MKFIALIGDGYWSYRFRENAADVSGFPFEGRIMIKSPNPSPGEYTIDNDFIKIEMGNDGYGCVQNQTVQFCNTTTAQLGGTVTITAETEGRVRIKFKDLKMWDMVHEKVVLASADLTY